MLPLERNCLKTPKGQLGNTGAGNIFFLFTLGQTASGYFAKKWYQLVFGVAEKTHFKTQVNDVSGSESDSTTR